MDQTDEWIDKAKAKYAYAFDPLGKLMGSVGLRSYPSAVLVDPSGRVVFGGSPDEIDDKMVEKAIRGALTEPIFSWPDELEDAVDAMRDRKLGLAITEAEAAGEFYAEYADELIALLDGQVDLIEESYEEGDYLAVVQLAKDLDEALKGRDQAEKVAAWVKDVNKDREKRQVLNAQKEIQKLLSKKIKRKDVPKHIKKLEKLREKFPDTIIDSAVDDAIEKLRDI